MHRTPLIALFCLVFATAALAAQRPTPIEPDGCALWVGHGVGNNDDTQLFELRICEGEGGAWTGVMQTSSLVSGYSVRAVLGTIEGVEYVGHETAFLEDAAEPGWMFCLVDEYRLHPENGALVGTYRSAECSDQANLELARVETAPSGGSGGP